jgi:hypothetical protein
MIDEPMLSTKEAPTRHGGLLLCGTNYGLGPGEAPGPETVFKPWGDYFTHESNKPTDRFVSGFALWFDWWDIPLEVNGQPTELNQAISQTNLFYDSSKYFVLRPPDEMAFAFARLRTSILRLNISGLIVASSQLVDCTRTNLSLPEWQIVHSGRFWMGFSSSDSLHVAVCPHPTSRQFQKDVKGLKHEMQRWIDTVLKEHRRKRLLTARTAERRVPSAPSGR